MGDAKSLASKLEDFMQHMTVRQQALEEQMEELTARVRESGKELGGGGVRGSSNGT